jgi:hypothetical protein
MPFLPYPALSLLKEKVCNYSKEGFWHRLIHQPADAISTLPCPLLVKGEGVQLLKREMLAQIGPPAGGCHFYLTLPSPS